MADARRGLILLAASVVAAAGHAGPVAARVPATQTLAVLMVAHPARSGPSPQAARVTTVPSVTPITRGQTALPVLASRIGTDGARWLQVLLPGRPNGRTAWIARRGTRRHTTVWHLVVRTAQRRVLVYRAGRRVRSFSAVVGKPATPTPHGRFFVEESVRMRPGSPGAPFALALSARSNVLQEFEGGPGQIALHGVANLGGAPGTAVSHGCVRLSDRSISWLAARIPPGAPVTITA